MTAFSIILRILTLGACGAAVYFWMDKQKVIAQKEAIIQETEFLVGYPTQERKKNDEVTQDPTLRKENFALIKEVTPDDASLTRMEELRKQLESIKGTDQFHLHGGKESIGGSDPNKNLTLRAHIEGLSQELNNKISRIEGLEDDKTKLEEELQLQKQLLGEEQIKVQARDETITQKTNEYEDLDNKHQQLQTTYFDEQKKHQQKLEDLQKALAQEKQALTLQVSDLTAEKDDLNQQIRTLKIENQRFLRQMQQGGAVATAQPPQTPIPGQPPQVPTASDNPLLPTAGTPTGQPGTGGGLFGGPPPINTKFLKFSEKTRQLALLVSDKALANYQGKKLDLLVQGKRIAALSIVKSTDQFTFFIVRQNPSTPEWQILTQLKQGHTVTIKAQ